MNVYILITCHVIAAITFLAAFCRMIGRYLELSKNESSSLTMLVLIISPVFYLSCINAAYKGDKVMRICLGLILICALEKYIVTQWVLAR